MEYEVSYQYLFVPVKVNGDYILIRLDYLVLAPHATSLKNSRGLTFITVQFQGEQLPGSRLRFGLWLGLGF